MNIFYYVDYNTRDTIIQVSLMQEHTRAVFWIVTFLIHFFAQQNPASVFAMALQHYPHSNTVTCGMGVSPLLRRTLLAYFAVQVCESLQEKC